MAEQLDPVTGLPKNVIQEGVKSPVLKNGIDEVTGLPNQVIQQGLKSPKPFSDVGVGFAGGISRNLTNVYTDPLSSYKDYDVNTNVFAKDWNEQRAINQPWYEQLGFGLTKALTTVGTSIIDGTLGTANGIGSILFDKDHSFADNTVGNSMDAVNEQMREWLPNYYTQAEQESLLSSLANPANFIGDKVAGGAAYTVGMLATMYLTGGMGVGGGALAGTRAIGSGIKALGTATKIGGNVSKLAANYRVIKALQAGADISKIVGRTANIQRLANGAKTLDVALTMGLAESAVEARETKKQFVEEQTALWKENHPGQEMPEEMKAGIEESALAAMNTNFLTNMVVLTATNAFTFGNMAFKAARGTQIAEDAVESAYKVTRNVGDDAVRYAESLSNNKLLRSIQKGNRIFGKGLAIAGSEAAQEGAQYASNIAMQEYYGKKFNNQIEGGFGDMMSALLKGATETFTSKDGLESMLIGAIVGGGTAAIQSRGISGKMAKNTEEGLKIMNSRVFQNIMENFEETERNINLAATISNKENSPIERENARRQLIHSYMRKYDKMGALDYANEELDDLAALDEADFKKRMGYDESVPLIEQTNGKTQQEVIQDIKDSAKKTFQLEKDINTITPLRAPQGIFAAMQSEKDKQNFILQQKVDREYRNLLFQSALKSEVATEHANTAYNDLISINPEFGKLDKNKLLYSIKLGDVSLNAQGEIEINAQPSAKLELENAGKRDQKFQEQLEMSRESFRNLSAPEQAKFIAALNVLETALGAKTSADVAFNELKKNPDKREFYVEAQRLLKKQKKQEIANDSAEQAIQNAATPEELESGVPADSSPEVIIRAKKRYKELKKLVKKAQKEFIGMNYNELNQLDADEIESTDPVRAQALRNELQERELKRKLDEHNETRAAIAPYIAPSTENTIEVNNFQEAQQEAFINELATITSDIAVIDSNGRQFVIQGRVYEVRQNPLDSLEFNENFNLTSVTLTDVKTGKEKRFNINIDFTNQEEIEQGFEQGKSGEDLIPEAIAHSILMNAIEIDEVNDNVNSALSVTEDARNTILAEALDSIEKEKAKKTNTDLTDSEKSIGTLKTERRKLKMINNKLLSMLDALDKAKNSERLSQDEFEAIDKIKDILDTLTTLGEIIDTKSEVIKSKQLKGDVTEPDFSTSAEEDNVLIQEENDAISDLNNKVAILNEAKQANEDILKSAAETPGYNDFTETDLANMRMEAGRLKAQVNELRAKIESHRENINLIKQLQDEARIAELQQAGEAALRSSIPTQREVTQGEDTSIDTGTPQQGIDKSEEIRQEEENKRIQAFQEELDKIKVIVDGNEIRYEYTQTTPTTPIVSTPTTAVVSNETLNLPLAQIEVQKPNVKSSQIVVSEDGTILSGNEVSQIDLNNNPIVLFPENISDPNNTVKIGDTAEFIVDENTKWWQENKDKYPVDEHWMHVPIFVKHNGVNIALLSAAKDKNQTDRKLIFANKNNAPTATIKGKLISDSNISNARTSTGEKVFYDPTTLVNQGGIGIVTTKGIQPFFGEFTEEQLVAISQMQSDNLLKGQVIIIGKDPMGNPKAFVASTKSMDEYGLTAVLNSIKESAFENVSQIIGANTILEEFISADQESYDDIKNDKIKDILYLEVLGSGELLFTFYSESAKSLIRISASSVQNALNSENDSDVEFSFVEFKPSEKEGVDGYDIVISERKDHKSFKKVILNELKQSVLKKKYQVSKDLLTENAPYTSKLTGIEYNSYTEYLASAQEFSEPRTEGLGHNSILSSDIVLSSSQSAFNNIGLEFGNLKIQNKEIPTQTQVERNAVKIQEPTAETPAAEVNVASTPTDDLFAEFAMEEEQPTPATSNQQTIEFNGNIYTVSIENGNGVIKNAKGTIINGQSGIGTAVLNKVNWDLLEEQPAPSTPTDKKAEIERIKEERIKKVESNFWKNNEKAYLDFLDELGGYELKAFKSDSEIIDYLKQRIETKYKEELAVLEGTTTTNKKTEIEKEKEKITPTEFKEVVRLANFFLENPKEPTVSGSVVTKYPELFKAITNIEKRRQEALKSISGDNLGQTFVTYTASGENINKDIENFISANENEIKNKINAKYDAELTALEGKQTTTSTTPTNKKIEYKREDFPEIQMRVDTPITQKLVNYLADVLGVPRINIADGTYISWITEQAFNNLGLPGGENLAQLQLLLNGPKQVFDRITKFAELAGLESKPSSQVSGKENIVTKTQTVDPDKIISILINDGYNARNFERGSYAYQNAFDPRKDVIENLVRAGESFAQITEHKNKNWLVVGLRTVNNIDKERTNGRGNYSMAMIEFNESLPDNIIEILEKAAKEHFKTNINFNENEPIKPITSIDPRLNKSQINQVSNQIKPAMSFEQSILSGTRQSTVSPEQRQKLEAEMAAQQANTTNLADLIEGLENRGEDINNQCK